MMPMTTGEAEDRHPTTCPRERRPDAPTGGEERRSASRQTDSLSPGHPRSRARAVIRVYYRIWRARSIFAAHRAYRAGHGATDEDPFFVHPHEPGRRSPAPVLREAIRRTCRQLRLDPPWVHGDNCRYGADVGLVHRRPGWMTERGLSMLMLDPQYPAHIPQPPEPPARVRPHHARGPER